MIDISKIQAEKPISELLEFGIFNIDKPSGPTSFGVDEIIKKKLNAKKTSHFGTLDPKVTGVLPIAINRACRLSDYFMHKNKTYVGVMRIHKNIEENKLKAEMEKFIGKIKQLPPVKSRVKREEREREIFSFKILEKQGQDVLFEAEVEAGTYIRKLTHDLGLQIGGAHMSELRRIKAGIFEECQDNFVNLYEFEKAVDAWKAGDEAELREILIPGEIISEVLPVVEINKNVIRNLYTGKFLDIKDTNLKKFESGEVYAGFSGEVFIGVYKANSQTQAKPEFVLTKV